MEVIKKTYISTKDETLRLFKNDFLESLTKVHPITPVVVFGPVVYYFFNKALQESGFSTLQIIGLFFSGLFFWTFFEYVLHRIVFHYEPKGEFGQKVHFLFHGIHHNYPKDSRRLVMPPVVSIILSSMIYLGLKTFVPDIYLSGFFSGFMFGYICYDVSHYIIHHYNFKNKWFVLIRNHHFIHHYQDTNRNFGVSTPLWDILINSLKK